MAISIPNKQLLGGQLQLAVFAVYALLTSSLSLVDLHFSKSRSREAVQKVRYLSRWDKLIEARQFIGG